MKSGPFIKLIADAYRVEEKTTAVYARFLREAGLLTTGARGVNAPHMTSRDAARMTIALLATDKPSMAVERLKRFARLPYRPEKSQGDHPIEFKVQDGVTLEDVLTSIFSADLTDDSDPLKKSPYIEIQENARSATIEYSGGKLFFQDGKRTSEQAAQDRREFLGIRRTRGIASSEIAPVYLPLMLERRDGFVWTNAPDPMLTVAALLEPFRRKPPEEHS